MGQFLDFHQEDFVSVNFGRSSMLIQMCKMLIASLYLIKSPFSFWSSFVFQYRIGQLYMISKHSHEQSERGEGVEVVQNEPYEDPEHGSGQFTEKRIYLNK